MSALVAQGVVLLLMLASLPLTAIGVATGTTWVSVLGLVAITLGGLVPPVLRFVDHDGEEDGRHDEGEDEADGDAGSDA